MKKTQQRGVGFGTKSSQFLCVVGIRSSMYKCHQIHLLPPLTHRLVPPPSYHYFVPPACPWCHLASTCGAPPAICATTLTTLSCHHKGPCAARTLNPAAQGPNWGLTHACLQVWLIIICLSICSAFVLGRKLQSYVIWNYVQILLWWGSTVSNLQMCNSNSRCALRRRFLRSSDTHSPKLEMYRKDIIMSANLSVI